MGASTPLDLAERIALIAAGLGIETALIGAYALAAHRYVRGTDDIDLASACDFGDLRRLETAVREAGFQTLVRAPDDEDPLGGVLVIWTEIDEEGDPIDPCEVVNFVNPYLPRRTPARDAIRNAVSLAEKPALRYPRLADLIALKLYAESRQDDADIVEVIARNLDADLEEVRRVAKAYGFERIDDLIAEAEARRR